MLAVFIVLLAILLFSEYKTYKTCITPFFVIGSIYLIAVPVVNIVGVRLGYYSISSSTMILFLLFLMWIFFLNVVFKLLYRKIIHKNSSLVLMSIKHQKYIWYAFSFFLLGYFLSLLQATQIYGITNIKGKSSGIFGHMGLFCISISPYIMLLYIKTKKTKYILGVTFLFLIMLLFGGKTYLFITAVSACILLFDEKKVTPIKLLRIGLFLSTVAILIFIIIYTVIPCLNANIRDWFTIKAYFKESLQHVFYYFSAPFLCSNSYFDMPIAEGLSEGLRIMFAPLVSLYEVLLGNREFPAIIMKEWVNISDAAHRTTSNVGGLFSESVFHIGYVGAIFYVGLASLYVHAAYYLKCKSQFFHASAALGIALLGLCFFCNYFTLLVVLEIIVYLFIFEFSLLMFENRRIYIGDWRFKKIWKKIKH